MKTSFIVPSGVYAFKRKPFRLSRAPTTFQKLMENVLAPVLNYFVRMYLNDIIVTFAIFSEHIQHLRTVVQLLYQAGLTWKLDKCSLVRK